jgi:hypothetical protein
MWSSSAILAGNETRIYIATVNAILTPTWFMSILVTGSCKGVNTKNQSGEEGIPLVNARKISEQYRQPQPAFHGMQRLLG